MAVSSAQNLPYRSLLLMLSLTIYHLGLTISAAKDPSKPSGFTLTLIPGDSPESPLFQGNLTVHERAKRLLRVTRTKTNRVGTDNIQLPLTRNDFYYAVKVGIGTPPHDVFLVLDTGSGVTWAQCEPCPGCPAMHDGNFDPGHSATYRQLSPNHHLCQDGYFHVIQNQCTYDFSYGAEHVIGPQPGSPRTAGIVSQEKFTFPDKKGGFSTLEPIIFGCSHTVQNFDDIMFNGIISGVIGMNAGPASFATQVEDFIDSKFSYCIPSVWGLQMPPILVSFGTDVPRIAPPLSNTLFVTPPGQEHFFLDLRDVTVGTRRVGFGPGTFRPSPDGRTGFIVDSGAPFSVLSVNSNGVNVYEAVMNQVEAHYHQTHGLPGVEDTEEEDFDYCFVPPVDFTDYLTLTFHFHPDADFVVADRDLHYFNSERGYFCVAITEAAGGLSILGAHQQQSKHIVYNFDLAPPAFQFATYNCPS